MLPCTIGSDRETTVKVAICSVPLVTQGAVAATVNDITAPDGRETKEGPISVPPFTVSRYESVPFPVFVNRCVYVSSPFGKICPNASAESSAPEIAASPSSPAVKQDKRWPMISVCRKRASVLFQ